MFKGQFKYSIDSKGRISIPAKLRKYVKADATDTFVVTRGMDGCIDVYPLDQWKEVEEKLWKLSPFNQKHSKLTRLLLQDASEEKLDSQARITLPNHLIEHAKIDKEVLIIGAFRKIEVWSPAVYDEYLKNSEETFEQIAEEVMSIR